MKRLPLDLRRDFPALHKDLEQALFDGETADCTRDEVLNIIQDFIESSFFIGFDPSPHLQKAFSSYEWRYQEIPDSDGNPRQTLESAIQTADFFWPVAGIANSDLWLMARRKGSSRPLSLCGCKKLLEIMNDPEISKLKMDELSPETRHILSALWGMGFKETLKSRPDI